MVSCVEGPVRQVLEREITPEAPLEDRRADVLQERLRPYRMVGTWIVTPEYEEYFTGELPYDGVGYRT